ncbi:MAG: ABC transporter permease, partial [Acidobacteriota bacterium]
MDFFLHLVRTGVRSLSRRPVFTLAAALSLALGIGANTTIFTLINAVFFAPLPGDAPDRLVAIYSSEQDPTSDGVFNGFLSMSFPNFEDYRDDNSTLDYMSTWHGTPFGLSGDGPPEQVRGEFVSG